METQRFFLYNEDKEFIQVDTDCNWTKTTVYKNEEKLGEIVGKENLEFGKPFQTSDNKIVYIKLTKPFFRKARIKVLINGNPYYYKEDTISNINWIKSVYFDIYSISVLSIIIGLISIIFDISDIKKSDFGYQSVIFGFIYFSLSYLFYKKNSRLLLISVIIILITDTVILLRFNFGLNHLYDFRYGLIVRVYFLYLSVRAIINFHKVEKYKENNAS